MNDAVILHAEATASAPALILRPWCTQDVPALVETWRDPVLRRWTGASIENDADALRWVRAQQRGWEAGARLGFAVLEAQPDPTRHQLVGNVVLKDVAAGKPSAEVGYWTAVQARGRGVATRALEAITAWAFDTFEAGGLKRLELLHQVDNAASCRVAQNGRYELDSILPATPPAFPLDGHLHIRSREA